MINSDENLSKTTLSDEKELSKSVFYRYHCDTKHTLEKLYSNKHSLDWANQPNPFRQYIGADHILLPRQINFPSNVSFFEAANCMHTIQRYLSDRDRASAAFHSSLDRQSNCTEPADLAFVSKLLYHSMALSAWKQIIGTQHRWALRVNPSSGNLHPVDTHLLINDVHGIAPGVYHYLVSQHMLEARLVFSNGRNAAGTITPDEQDFGEFRPRNVPTLKRLWELLQRTDAVPPLVICLTNIFWRESWKYQSRAFRYCQHDTGHAICSLMMAAAALGWQCEVVCEFPDEALLEILELDNSDERPMVLLLLRPFEERKADTNHEQESTGSSAQSVSDEPVLSSVKAGVPNKLSDTQIIYPKIDEVYRATCLSADEWLHRRQDRCRQSSADNYSLVPDRFQPNSAETVSLTEFDNESFPTRPFHQIVRSRRSAVDMDGRQRTSLSRLASMLTVSTKGFLSEFCTPRSDMHNTTGGAYRSAEYLIHLYTYVHRVDGLLPGLYYFHRDSSALHMVKEGSQQQVAKFVSCMQDIASDGCFAVSMVANFNRAFHRFGERAYRYVHHEAGFIGQLLYLSATALGLEATGIGCFLDDEVNHHAELPPGFEVVYNFTVGRAVNDGRLTSLPAYDFS